MKQKYPTNIIIESYYWIPGMKSVIKNVCLIVSASVAIWIGICGCKKEEPQQEEASTSTSVPLEEQRRNVQDKAESAGEIQLVNSIELAKWTEGKALAGHVATELRAYAAENGPNRDYKNITMQKLFATPNDLQGHYFNINNFQLDDVSFDQTRSEYPLRYTITVNRPDDSWKIKSFQLLHTGQWIQTP